MTTVPGGWYPDPDPAAPSAGQRWWDGTHWTDRVHLPLAGWWWRALAAFFDGIVVAIVTYLVTLPVQLDVRRESAQLQREFADRLERGEEVAFGDFMRELLALYYADHLLALIVVPMLLALTYHAGFLRSRGATPGKLMCGLRVRLREIEGRLPWRAIGARLAFQWLPTGVFTVGAATTLSLWWIFGGSVLLLFIATVDALWATGARRQTLHDLAARTIVVKTR